MKKAQILIITLVIILVLGCTTFAVLYFATDIFKSGSNKESFNKYIAQMDLKEFIDIETFNTNLQRKQNEEYISEGYIDINVNVEGESLIDEKIEYNSKVDPINDKASSEINIEINGENELTVNYLKDEDLYGISFKDIINQYMVLENNNLREMFSNAETQVEGIDITIPDKIEIPEEYIGTLNIEELKQIFSRYVAIVLQEIPEENYSKVEKQSMSIENKSMEVDGYSVKIDSVVLRSALGKILETMQNDEQLFNLINELRDEDYSSEEYKELLEATVEKISIDESVGDIYITVYKSKDETVKVYIKCGEQLECSIQKKSIQANLRTEDGQNMKFNINKNTDGSYELLYVAEKDGEEQGNISIVYNNTTTFDSSIEIEDYSKINHVVINDFNNEQLGALAKLVINELVEKTNIENGILGKIVTNIMTITGDTLSVAQTAEEETKKNMIYEAMALAKADFIEDYYSGEIESEISEQQIKEKIEEYIQDISVNVTKNGNTHEYIITVDQMDLDEEKSKLDLSFLDS